MKKKYYWNAPLLSIVALFNLILGIVGGYAISWFTYKPETQTLTITQEVCEEVIDSSAIDLRGRDITGTVRMICAERLTDNILIDRSGEAWEVDYPLSPNDLYLLWIDDMGNDNIEDDAIINIWICG